MTKNKHMDTKNANDQKNPQTVSEKQSKKKSFLGENKALLIKVGLVVIAAAVVAMIIAIAKNQALFQEFLSVL